MTRVWPLFIVGVIWMTAGTPTQANASSNPSHGDEGEACFHILDYWTQVAHEPHWDAIAHAHPTLAPLRSETTEVFKVWYPAVLHGFKGYQSRLEMEDYHVTLFVPAGRGQSIRLFIRSRYFPDVSDDMDGDTEELNKPFLHISRQLNNTLRVVRPSVVHSPERTISTTRFTELGMYQSFTTITVPTDYDHLFFVIAFTRRLGTPILIQAD